MLDAFLTQELPVVVVGGSMSFCFVCWGSLLISPKARAMCNCAMACKKCDHRLRRDAEKKTTEGLVWGRAKKTVEAQ